MLFFSDFFLITLIKKIKKVEIHSIFDLSYKKTGEKCCVWRGTGSPLMADWKTSFGVNGIPVCLEASSMSTSALPNAETIETVRAREVPSVNGAARAPTASSTGPRYFSTVWRIKLLVTD